MGAEAWGAILGAVAGIAAIVVKWWWSNRRKRREDQRRQDNEEISRRADAGDAAWFNDRLDQWMRQGDD